MEPISRKKTSVSPFNIPPSSEPVPDYTPAPEPIRKPITGNTVLAPEPSEPVTDLASVDKRVDALINYLEKWIQVGNLKMTNIKEYIQNYHD